MFMKELSPTKKGNSMNTQHNISQNFVRGSRRFQRLTLLVVLHIFTICAMAQTIRITGVVLNKETREPLVGVNIVDVSTNRLLANTDMDGRFATDVRANGKLRFSMVNAKSVTIKVDNRKHIEVLMDVESTQFQEAVVSAKRITNKIMPEVTTIEIIGNTAAINTNVRMPVEMYSPQIRYVAQPVMWNVTRGTYKLMRPLVYDASQYHATQDRMYDFNMKEKDPLASYVTLHAANEKSESGHYFLIPYSDSVYCENAKDNYKCDFYQALEDYTKILWRDTMTIAKGTVNPLRFLEYTLGGCDLEGKEYIPEPEIKLRQTQGEIRLRFAKGSSQLNTQDEQNIEELERLSREMRAIAADPNATLSAFSIMGIASPDGTYRGNLNLANRRMQSALNEIMKYVSAEDRRRMEVQSNARVATWDEVVVLLRRDSLFDQAYQIEEIIGKYKGIDNQGKAIKRLSFYSLLEEKYLPQLRRVQYKLDYSIFRQLTTEEIKELYKEDFRSLTRFEYYRLFNEETDEEKREEYLRNAVNVYPRFLLAANQLAVARIKKDAPELELLENAAGEKAPYAVNLNHTIALLHHGHFEAADSLVVLLDPAQPQTRMVKAISDAYNGHYEAAYPIIQETGMRNQVLMLLAMKRNQEAFELAKQLPDDKADHHYIRAICLNRLENPLEAEKELKKAFKMDSSLLKIAEIDGDVNGLLEKEKK